MTMNQIFRIFSNDHNTYVDYLCILKVIQIDFILEYPGFLKVNPTTHLLPDLEKILNPPLNLCHFSGGCFAAGDLRANEQIVLASTHTLWVHEHNRLARILKYINQHWDSERIFQEARKIVIAELQHITYNEYLTKFLGKDVIPGKNTSFQTIEPNC
jgi:hypothetical protein